MDSHINITEDGNIIIRDILARTKFAKTEVCKGSPMTDAPAMMMLAVAANEDDSDYEAISAHCAGLGLSQVVNVGFAPLTGEDIVQDFMQGIKAIAGQVKTEYLFIVAEGYMRQMDSVSAETALSEANGWERGALAKDFSENPFSDVREGIIVSGVDCGLNKAFITSCTYTYDDHGVPQYDDEQSQVMDITDELIKEQTAGRVVHTLAVAAGLMQVSWDLRDFIGNMMTRPDNGEDE